jgi:hypothetical protein
LEVTMRFSVRSLSVAGLLMTATIAANAQGFPRRPLPPVAQGRPGAAIARERMAARRMAMQERMRAGRAPVAAGDRRAMRRTLIRRQVMRRQIRAMTPEQRQQFRGSMQAFRTERQRVGGQVRNGSITREQARQQLQAWRQKNAPNLGLRGPRKPGGGEF